MASLPKKGEKREKWSEDEDTLLTQLRAEGLKWEEISQRLPGRSAISCRLHFQNYLDKRTEWSEDNKNKLARLYERHVQENVLPDQYKDEFWKAIADEMSMPSHEVEAMHWQMGQDEMARRAAAGLSQRHKAVGVPQTENFSQWPARYAPLAPQPIHLAPAYHQKSLSDHSAVMESRKYEDPGSTTFQRMETFQQEQAQHASPKHQSMFPAPAYGQGLGLSDPCHYSFGSGNRNRK